MFGECVSTRLFAGGRGHFAGAVQQQFQPLFGETAQSANDVDLRGKPSPVSAIAVASSAPMSTRKRQGPIAITSPACRAVRVAGASGNSFRRVPS